MERNMAKLKIFTNAAQAFDGDSIAINADIVASVFELNTVTLGLFVSSVIVLVSVEFSFPAKSFTVAFKK